MNKKGFTLVELMISMVIFMGVLLVFFYIVKNTVLFVNFYKQEITLFNNVNLIKLKINESFHHDKITLLPTQELSMTGIYSIKDKTVLNNQKIYSRDVLSFEYEDKTSSGGLIFTRTGVFALGIMNNSEGKIIISPSSKYGFFGIRYLSGTENILEYTVNNTGTISFSQNDYINTSVKIQEFRYSLVESGAYLRIDMVYDNDIDGKYESIGEVDEYYFSGSTYFLKKIDLK